MPDIAGQVVILTISDADLSAVWYCQLLGMQETGRHVRPDGHVELIQVAEPRSGLELCFVDHGAGPGKFSEFCAGLDHLEFTVAQRSAIYARAARLIQLEFFWRAD